MRFEDVSEVIRRDEWVEGIEAPTLFVTRTLEHEARTFDHPLHDRVVRICPTDTCRGLMALSSSSSSAADGSPDSTMPTIVRIDGPHFATYTYVDEVLPSSSLLYKACIRTWAMARLIHINQTCMIAPISNTVGNSIATVTPSFWRNHSFHLSGLGDDAWTTRAA